MTSSTNVQTKLTTAVVVKNGAKSLGFYTKAFNADIVSRYGAPGERLVAKLSIEGNEFWIEDEDPECENFSPETIGGSPVRMVLIVSDPDLVYNNAVAAGATSICPVRTEEFWRIGKLKDPFGHIWEIGHPLQDE